MSDRGRDEAAQGRPLPATGGKPSSAHTLPGWEAPVVGRGRLGTRVQAHPGPPADRLVPRPATWRFRPSGPACGYPDGGHNGHPPSLDPSFPPDRASTRPARGPGTSPTPWPLPRGKRRSGGGPCPGGLRAGVQRALRPLAPGFAAGQEAELRWRRARPTGSLSPFPSGAARRPSVFARACDSAPQLASPPLHQISDPAAPGLSLPLWPPTYSPPPRDGRQVPRPQQETLGAQHKLLISGVWGSPAQAAQSQSSLRPW